jgi:hypothetical protein
MFSSLTPKYYGFFALPMSDFADTLFKIAISLGSASIVESLY